MFKLPIVIIIAYLLLPTALVSAQGLDATQEFAVTDQSAKDGDILINSGGGLKRADKSYDFRMFGVMVSQPLIVLKTNTSANNKPVTRSGSTNVNVSTLNGPIKTGDYVTSSEILGKGQKSALSGYVVGIALADFDPDNNQTGLGVVDKVDYTPKKVTRDDQPRKVSTGQIPVAVKIEFADLAGAKGTSLLFNRVGSLIGNVAPPEKFVDAARYLIAGLIAVLSILFGFMTFARSIPKSVEAIGRNPLAQRSIELSIILNIVFTIGIALVGIIAAVVIIRI